MNDFSLRSCLQLFYFIFATVEAQFNLPPYLHSCSKSDPNFNRCMISNAEALLPEIINGNETYNIPNLNPLTVPKLSIRQGNKQIGLNMVVRDIRVYGINTIKAIELELNMDNRYVKSRSVIHKLEIHGLHKTAGNVLVINVYGEGKFFIVVENIDYTYETTFDYEKRDNGYEYAVTRMQNVTINNIGKVTFNLENMFGDEKLNTAVNDLLNKHWRELSNDLFHEMSDELLEISRVIIDTILGVFPVQAIVKD